MSLLEDAIRTLVRSTLRKKGRNFFSWMHYIYHWESKKKIIGCVVNTGNTIKTTGGGYLTILWDQVLQSWSRTGKSKANEFHQCNLAILFNFMDICKILNLHIQSWHLVSNSRQGFKEQPPGQYHNLWCAGREGKFFGILSPSICTLHHFSSQEASLIGAYTFILPQSPHLVSPSWGKAYIFGVLLLFQQVASVVK